MIYPVYKKSVYKNISTLTYFFFFYKNSNKKIFSIIIFRWVYIKKTGGCENISISGLLQELKAG